MTCCIGVCMPYLKLSDDVLHWGVCVCAVFEAEFNEQVMIIVARTCDTHPHTDTPTHPHPHAKKR